MHAVLHIWYKNIACVKMNHFKQHMTKFQHTHTHIHMLLIGQFLLKKVEFYHKNDEAFPPILFSLEVVCVI